MINDWDWPKSVERTTKGAVLKAIVLFVIAAPGMSMGAESSTAFANGFQV